MLIITYHSVNFLIQYVTYRHLPVKKVTANVKNKLSNTFFVICYYTCPLQKPGLSFLTQSSSSQIVSVKMFFLLCVCQISLTIEDGIFEFPIILYIY